MFCQRVFSCFLIAIAIWAFLPSGQVVHAQGPPLESNEPSPATRHAQVIAHGVMAMPADEIAWRLTADRAVPSARPDAEERPAGFTLADKGVVALVDQHEHRLVRIAPGEAIWNESGAEYAVVSLERKAPRYYDIALVPATEMPEDGVDMIGGVPFAAPSGDAFDIDLIRDVLNRTEESVFSTGPSPALLLVTSGTVYVDSTSGGVVEMTAGQAAQIAGDVVVTGAGRVPAAFVMARVGPEVPSRITSKDMTPEATPASIATPVLPPESASVAISARLCPMAYTRGNDLVDCTTPASEVGFSLMSTDAATVTALVNDEGDVSFSGIEPGYYTLSAEHPADFAASRIRCRNASGDNLVARSATNHIAMLLAVQDEVICTWHLVPATAEGDMPADPTVPAPVTPTSEEIDSDGDRLTDALETTLGTDPSLPDSDGDGVSDSDENDFYGTDPLDLDTDGDELDDAEELLTYGTNPLLADTDGDDVSDGEEVNAGFDPLDASSLPVTPTPNLTRTPEPTREPALDGTPASDYKPVN